MIVVITPPDPLVTADDAKAWAPVLREDDDARVEALLAVAQAAIEPPNGWLGRALGMQVLEARYGGFGEWRLVLPCPPVRELVSVTYRDPAGVDRTLALDAVRIVGLGTATVALMPLAPIGWPATDCDPEAVRVRFRAGYAIDDREVLPVRHAIVLGSVQLRALSTQDLALRSRTTEGVGGRTWTVSDAAAQLVKGAVDDLLMPLRIYA